METTDNGRLKIGPFPSFLDFPFQARGIKEADRRTNTLICAQQKRRAGRLVGPLIGPQLHEHVSAFQKR